MSVEPKPKRKSRPKPVRAPRRFTPAIPERYQHLVGAMSGVDLLKALYFLNEGERLGREGSQVADRLQAISAGVAALLEHARSEPTATQTLPFPRSRTEDGPVDPGTAKDIREYAMSVAGGDSALANAAYARIMDITKRDGTLNSRWQRMVEDVIESMREARPRGARVPSPDGDPLLGEDEGETEFDDGV